MSKIFYSDYYKEVEQNVIKVISQYKRFLTPQVINSPRSAGEAVQEIAAEHFGTAVGDYCEKLEICAGRRSMADLKFFDQEGIEYYVDIKTHNKDTKFNMPNLLSVRRIYDLYQESNKYFAILFVTYKSANNQLEVNKVRLFPIEFLDWSCLSIGALGWGQIQISNSNKIVLNPHKGRDKWICEFRERILAFYENEAKKITERKEYFSSPLNT